MKKRTIPALLALILPIILLLVLFPAQIPAEPLYSSSWGFRLDLPEGYQYINGDGKDKYTFKLIPGGSPTKTGVGNFPGASFEILIYPPGPKSLSLEALSGDIRKRLNSKGDISYFNYRNKKAALLELDFPAPSPGNTGTQLSGWGLCLELETRSGGTPLLLALAYGEAGKEELELLHLSALDSIAPSEGERRVPGPITEFTYPRGKRISLPLAGLGVEAPVYENDDDGAQSLVDREFAVLQLSANSPRWKEAWTRFYRAIYRDSFGRLKEIAFALERHWNKADPDREMTGMPVTGPAKPVPVIGVKEAMDAVDPAAFEQKRRELARKALEWVQSFSYERNLLGSDFVNLVSAAAGGRGDCDSRAMLWAIILGQANIPAAIMVSADYGHSMGLADIAGSGARFDWEGTRWLVAETTAPVSLGLIEQGVSDPAHWLGIRFE
jgi:hypothetical protein